MPVQISTNQLKNNAIGAAKAKLDELWSFQVAPQSTQDASNGNDLVRLSQVEGLLQGIHWKESARVATTGNITLSGTQTIDGVACIAGQRILVRAQTDGTQNGVYEVAAGAWSRSDDLSTGSEFHGASLGVREGSTYADKIFVCSNDSVTLGVTAITFIDYVAGQVADEW